MVQMTQHKNRIADMLDDDRDYTPEECEKMCNEAMDAAIAHIDGMQVPESMKSTVKAGFVSMTSQMLLNLKFKAMIKGAKLREEIQAGMAISEGLSTFWEKYNEGVNACHAKGNKTCGEKAPDAAATV